MIRGWSILNSSDNFDWTRNTIRDDQDSTGIKVNDTYSRNPFSLVRFLEDILRY